MRARLLVASVGVFLHCVGGGAQPTPPPLGPSPGVPKGPTPTIPLPLDLTPQLPVVPIPNVVPTPKEKSVDELLAEIEQLRAQKAELDKKEQELIAALRKKLDAQTERVKKLGLAQKEKEPEPDRVSRVTVHGVSSKYEKQILDTAGLRPGQVLHYPALEEARVRLEKAGFVGVSVAVDSDGPNSNLKDIRIQAIDPSLLPAPLPKTTELPAPPKR